MDLGVELAGFDDDEHKPKPTPDDLPRLADLAPTHPGRLVPLADLQREGFNTTPPVGYQTKEMLNAVYKQLFAGIGDVIGSFDSFGAMLEDVAEGLNSLAAQLDPPPDIKE